jgi:hypothetical protein
LYSDCSLTSPNERAAFLGAAMVVGLSWSALVLLMLVRLTSGQGN